MFKTLVHQYYVQKSCKKAFYVLLLKFGHFAQNIVKVSKTTLKYIEGV